LTKVSNTFIMGAMENTQSSQETELKQLLWMLDERSKYYWILDTKVDKIPKQLELFNDFKNRLNTPIAERSRFYLYYGGNGSGKTAWWAYITALLAIWEECSKYWLPYIGSKKNIWVGTKSGSNVKSVIDPYLLWDYSIARIPPELIEKPNYDNGILKWIILKNGCKIHIKTYDQGSENLQGWNPDWIWLDEEPVNEDVWDELVARTRNPRCEMLVTMTPLSWLTKVYSFFFEQNSEVLAWKSKIYRVSSIDNPFTDKTWTLGMDDESYRLRVEWSFENPTGLVYSSFMRSKNVVPHFEPKLLWKSWDDVKYYRAIDFWTSHPTAIVWVAQDIDDNLYVFDEYEESDTLLWDIVDAMRQKSYWYEFEYTVRDSAAKREWIEIQKLGIRTVAADKYSKWANDMSNRRASILMINEHFYNKKLFISDRCKKLIRQLETHYYKDGKRDGEVIKENDDLLDALRYIVFMIRKNNSINKKSIFQREYEKKFNEYWRIWYL